MDTSRTIDYQRIAEASEAELQTLTTRHALLLYRRWRLAGAIEYRYTDERSDAPYQHAAMERLKALLATRPHVPGKAEGKVLRREAAKRGR